MRRTLSSMLLIAGLVVTAAGRERPPNIIFFLADELGYKELGCYGQEKIKTPHIDALAAGGMKLTQFYSGQTVCAPTRCAFLTGRHMGHAIIRNNRGTGVDRGQMPLPEGVTTVAGLLKDQGYATACIGKWGLGHIDNSGDPLKQGFDLFFGYLCQMHAHHFYPEYLWKNGEKVPYPGNETYRGPTYSATEMNREALEFVRQNREQPFFLYYATPIPHVSLQVPEEDLKEYEGKWEERPFENDAIERWEAKGRKGALAYTGHPMPRAAYAAMISHMDRNVGNLMDLLDDLDLADDTIFIFTSDNGTTFTGGVDRQFFGSLGGLRGHKCNLWEGGIRVPFVARWPGHIEPGSSSDHVAAIWDMLPTFCEASGAPVPGDTDGISLLPELTGRPQAEHEYLYWEYSSKGGQQAVRLGDWKGVRPQVTKNVEDLQLYDLKEDAGERENVAAEHPEVVARILKIMDEAHVPSEVFPLRGVDTKE